MKDLVRLIILATLLSAASLPALAWRPQSGSASAQRTMTTPGGKSYESSGSATYGNGSASGQRTVTGPSGQSYQSNTTGSYGNGSGSANRTVTTPNGGSYSGSGSSYRPPGW